MPEREGPQRRTLVGGAGPHIRAPNYRSRFVELGVATCFSFLKGASDAVDLALTAHAAGYDALGVADLNSFAGAVRMHTECKELGIRPIVGCRLQLISGEELLAYPRDRTAYGNLCTLLSLGKMSDIDGAWQAKGECHITFEMVAQYSEGVHLILIPPADLSNFEGQLKAIKRQLPSLSYVAAPYHYTGDDERRIAFLDRISKANGLSIVATNDVLYHKPSRRPLQDIMTAIKHKTTVEKAGKLLLPNAERYLKPPEEMGRLYRHWPKAIKASRRIADSCAFSLDELKYEYPQEEYPEGRSAQEQLSYLTYEGIKWRYPDGMSDEISETVERELALIGKLTLARYFLTIRDIVDFARAQTPPILCQGRGSAANSAVCYLLGITSVDPSKHALLFDRFISEERKEPPDIDVDFEHERREEVIQYIYQKYGRERAGLCATVIHYRPRMAIREVGKAMGLSEDTTAALARTVWGSWGKEIEEKHANEAGLDTTDPYLKRVLKLAEQMVGMPRHLSQHVGGFILTDGPLIETVPIGNGAMPDRSFIEWDKDDIEALGILKIDILALGMLTCIRKCLDLVETDSGRKYTLATVPREDPKVYKMLQKGDTLGVFQVESRAQMNMLPRLKPREFYDLVIQVAIVRPGPIQGDMVHPYLKRRRGAEEVVIPKPAPEFGPPDELSNIVSRTLGVPIFQEQAMKIALDAAKFSPAEANRLRKGMATFRSRGMVDELQDMMVERMVARGYNREFAERCFNQIRGFGEYGFPESHAASFAHLVYVSSWLKCHHPAAFACALLNSQPMGFYAPSQIVQDAQRHGVNIRPVDVNFSNWDNDLQAGEMQMGFRQIEGLAENAIAKLITARQNYGKFESVEMLQRCSGISPAVIERLAVADTFRSVGLSRRQALWDARSLLAAPELPLFEYAAAPSIGSENVQTNLPAMPMSDEVVADYQTLRLSLKAHPMVFMRAAYGDAGFTRAADLRSKKYSGNIKIAGLVLIRQRPGSAKGVCFITLEDETGVANLVIWPDVMERFRQIVMTARLLEVRGRVEYDDEVVHIIVTHLEDGTGKLALLSDETLRSDLARADHVSSPLGTKLKISRNVACTPTEERPSNVMLISKSKAYGKLHHAGSRTESITFPDGVGTVTPDIHVPASHPRREKLIP